MKRSQNRRSRSLLPGPACPGKWWIAVPLLANLAFALPSSAAPVELAKLTPDDHIALGRFGSDIAAEGNRVVIGRIEVASSGPGSAYVFEFDGATWNQVAKLVAGDAQTLDHFGADVVLSGDRIIVGANTEDGGVGDPLTDAGAAYVFDRDAFGNWNEVARLTASNAAASDFFSVFALDGDRAVCGARLQDTAAGANAGMAYVFERDGGGNWNEVATLTPSDPQANDHFGVHAALDGDRIVVGALREDGGAGDPTPDAGAVYVFERDGSGNWNETAKVTAAGGESGDQFGSVVSLDGDRLAIGASFEDGGVGNPLPDAGAIYVFDRDGSGTWNQVAKLAPADLQAGDTLWQCEVVGDRILVGARKEDGGAGDPLADAGAAYLFERDGAGDWNETAVLRPAELQPADNVGGRVALTPDFAFLAGNFEDGGPGDPLADAGAVYVFDLRTSVTIGGSVVSACAGPMAGLVVDLELPGGDLLTTTTGASGDYVFAGVPSSSDSAVVSVVLPLGFAADSPVDGQFVAPLGADGVVDFSLGCVDPQGVVRSMGYWKHQANVYLTGRGHAQESQADMESGFPAALFHHFYENSLQGIEVEGVTYMDAGGGPAPLDLSTIAATLSIKGRSSMEERAKQQYLALLLNLASGKLLTTSVVSDDGRTASQALQYVADLIVDGIAANDETAKDVADTINNADAVAAGVIPDSYSTIHYAVPQASGSLFRILPNPVVRDGACRFSFSMPASGRATLDVYDVTGRRVATVFSGRLEAGPARISWNRPADEQGRSLAQGVYFARLATDRGAQRTVKFVHLGH